MRPETATATTLIFLGVAGCVPTPPALVDIPLGAGYREPADRCRRAGESAMTVAYLDDASDLVACPAGSPDLGAFVTETGADEAARAGGYVLYSVPRR